MYRTANDRRVLSRLSWTGIGVFCQPARSPLPIGRHRVRQSCLAASLFLTRRYSDRIKRFPWHQGSRGLVDLSEASHARVAVITDHQINFEILVLVERTGRGFAATATAGPSALDHPPADPRARRGVRHALADEMSAPRGR